MTAIHDRRATQTHLVNEAVPAILDAIGDTAATVAEIAARLGADDERDALQQRLDELVASGLVELVASGLVELVASGPGRTRVRYRFDVTVGPVAFRIGSAWRAPIAALAGLYRDYPDGDGVADYTVRLEPTRPWRRWLRPSVAIAGDFMLPEAVPVALRHALLAAEMGMNLQLALGERRFLLLHAASVEKDGRVLILTGESGSGKSTLAALLGASGWRLLGDEFALIDPVTGLVHPFPRPVSLKNASIAVVADAVPGARFGPELTSTPKGTLRHLVPNAAALGAMHVPAPPAAIVFPRFGLPRAVRAVPPDETFMRLTQASTNYAALGERGFDALTRLVEGVPAVAIDYPTTRAAFALITAIEREL